MVVVTAGILIGIGAASVFVLLSVAAYVLAGMAQAVGMVPTAVLPEATAALDAVGLGLGLSVLVAFNWLSNREMRRALQLERQPRATLRQQSQQLEQQVAERTIALTTANEQLQQEITERVRVEEALQESEDRYRTVSELTSAYAFRVEPDGELVREWVTGALVRITGFTADELHARGGWESMVHPDDLFPSVSWRPSWLADRRWWNIVF